MSLWRGDKALILASQSRTRQQLLAGAGLDARTVPAAIDERAIAADVSGPTEIAALLARTKALAVSAQHPGHHVIGADQTLALGARMFNKPPNLAAAADQLQALAGRTHHLHSAIAVVCDGVVLFETIVSAAMTMRPLEAADIDAYLAVAGDRVTISVGAYQLEGPGIHLFEAIEGDYFTILGLPLLPLLAYFRSARLLAF